MSGLERDFLSRLYALHAQRILRFARQIMHDRSDAEDVVQDVFAGFCRDGAPLGRTFPFGWLMVVVRNRALDVLRRKTALAAATRGAASQPAHPVATPENELLEAQLLLRIRGALDRLPEQERRTLELAWFEELSHAQIADQCATPLGTVKSRCRAGQSRLRRLVK